MSVRLYMKLGTTKSQVPECSYYERGERAYLWPSSIYFKDLRSLDLTHVKYFDYMTIDEDFWKEVDGFCFTPGQYVGEGFEVSVSPSSVSNRGSEKNSIRDWKQKVFGRFNSVEIAIAFWEALTHGEILPTRPLCRELTLSEKGYAKQASLAVANSARIRELSARLDLAMNHIESLQQARQDQVAVPA